MKSIDYYMSLPYRLVIIPDAEEGGFTAAYPELPGCLTCAETKDEIFVMAEDAKRTWLESMLDMGNEIPEPEEMKERIVS